MYTLFTTTVWCDAGDEEDGSEGGEGLQRSALSDEDLEQYKVRVHG
jgi:hypothetical protein